AKETFSYRGAENVETGSTGWELEIAKTMMSSKKGNCYSWAAAFTYMARKVGYPATAIAGESISEKGNRS
ncbi:transglutaminase domain-containing protein, partial [Acinetobacter baumannii]|nr:transglutaminase domain-containing protein [Acinetobacter baumannii]